MPVTCDKLEKEAKEWIESVTGEQFEHNKTFQENLKDGTLLCKLFNNCFIDMKVKYTHSAMPFKQMENIASFLAALMKIPTFRSFDLFSTVDLYEGKNMAQVTRCILACKRFAEREEELLARGVESLSIQKEKKIEDEVKVEVEAMKVKDENEDEKEVKREDEKEEDDLFVDIMSATPTSEPEVLLIDSPMADDESDPITVLKKTEEEYETFTQENPGTFEIQVSH